MSAASIALDDFDNGGVVNESPLFTYHVSGDVSLPLRVKLSSLEGDFLRLNKELCQRYNASIDPLWNTQSVQAVAQLFADDMAVGPPVSSNYSNLFSNMLIWNEVLEFPVDIKDLPLTSRLVFTLKLCIGPGLVVDLGASSIELFTKKLTFVRGRQKLFVWPGRSGDGAFDSTTPGKRSDSSEMDKIEKRLKKFDAKEIERVDWLDKFVGKAIENLQQRTAASPDLALFITFPEFNNPIVFHQKALNSSKPAFSADSVFVLQDFETSRSNPAEDKHLMISRAKKGGIVEQDLKPNSDEKTSLETIIAYPPTLHLSGEEKELLWRFRFWLQSNKKALTKFLKSVDWNKPSEEKEAIKLMEKWDPIDTVDALELLSFHFKENSVVRSYAVKRLYRADDKELQDYLLQLVQALRYDTQEATSDLAIFLMQKSIVNLEIGCQIFWYFSIEKSNPIYRNILVEILRSLEGLPEGKQLIRFHQTQKKAVKALASIAKKMKELGSSVTREKKAEIVKEWLKSGKYPDLTVVDWVPLPIDPSYRTSGIKEEISVFKSAMAPLRIVFKVDNPHYGKNEFSVLFKVGDDLRQDQLVVQLISLMDRLLKKENLDLNIIIYKVLATSKNHGMIEMVMDSKNVATVLEEYPGDPKALQSFLRAHHPDKSGPYGIDKDVFEKFLRSNAGYCVITYILGVGDRHLDNLLVAKSGELFHIDYGFILGRDPRAFPPPMKLSPQMVEAMGGQGSEHFTRFKSYCVTAYNILRKSSNLILNLVSLVIDAEIGPSIHGEQSLLKVQEKFKLELTDEQAVEAFQQLIMDSTRALSSQFTDTFHRWAQYWRD